MTRLSLVTDPIAPTAEAPPAKGDRPQRHVVIAIPAYTGQIHLGTMRAIITDMLLLTERGDRVTIHDDSGNAMIADCRALIVAQFLATKGTTDLVFVDSDVLWQAGQIVRLVDAPVDCAMAMYPQRKDPITYSIAWKADPELKGLRADPATGLLEVERVPAGCLKLSRAMLERMVAHYTDTEFFCEAAPDQKAWALFDPYRIGRVKFGEDFSFCRRWTDIGGKVWIDPLAKMGHVGYKTFFGSIGEWLKSRPAEEVQGNGDTSPRDRAGRPSGA